MHSGVPYCVNNPFEFPELCGRERLVWFVRGGEMRENAGKAQIWVARYPDCKRNRFGCSCAVAAQACIDLEMN